MEPRPLKTPIFSIPILALFLLLWNHSAKGQFIFQETLSYGGGVANVGAVDAAQGQAGFGIGFTYEPPGGLQNEPSVTALDAQGAHLWTRRIVPVDPASFYSAEHTIATDDGGYLQVGWWAGGFDLGTIYATHYDAAGNLDWHQGYSTMGQNPRTLPHYALEVADGYLVTGEVADGSPEQRDAFLMLISKVNGSILWQHRYLLEDSDEEGTMITEDSNGNLFISGQNHGSNGPQDAYVFKTDASGGLLWVKTYGMGFFEYANAIAITPDDGFILSANQSANPNGGQLLLMRCDQNGVPLWTERIPGHYGDDLIPTPDGKWAALHHVAGGNEPWITKIETTGSSLWTRRYTGPGAGSMSFDGSSDQGFVFATRPGSPVLGFAKADFYGDTRCNVVDGEIAIFSVDPTVGDVNPTTDEPFVPAALNYATANENPNVDVLCCGAGLCAPPNSGINSRFERHFGGKDRDEGYSILNTYNNGFLLGGATSAFSSQGRDLLFVQSDNYGNYCWAMRYDLGTNDDEWALDLTKTPQNDLCDAYYFTGLSTRNNDELIIGQLNGQGAMQWCKGYFNDGPSMGTDIDFESTYINATGYTTFSGAEQEEGVYLALLPDGTQAANFTYGEDGSNERFYTTIRIGPYFTMAGITDANDAATGKDVYFVQTIGNVSSNYDFRFGTAYDDIAFDMVNYNGKFYVTGRTYDPLTEWNIFLAQVNVADGNLDWFNVFRGEQDDLPYAMHLDAAKGRIYIAGQTSSNGAGNDPQAFLLEADLNGNLVKAATYGGGGTEVFNSLVSDQFNRLAANGSTNSFKKGDEDFYFCKMFDLETECEKAWAPIQLTLPITAVAMNGDLGPAIPSNNINAIGNSQIDTFGDACDLNGDPGGGGDGRGKTTSSGSLLDVEEGFELFPNPTDAAVTLRYRYRSGQERHLEIYDLGGRLLSRQRFSDAVGSLEIDTRSLVPGMYLVKVTDLQGGVEVQKLNIRR